MINTAFFMLIFFGQTESDAELSYSPSCLASMKNQANEGEFKELSPEHRRELEARLNRLLEGQQNKRAAMLSQLDHDLKACQSVHSRIPGCTVSDCQRNFFKVRATIEKANATQLEMMYGTQVGLLKKILAPKSEQLTDTSFSDALFKDSKVPMDDASKEKALKLSRDMERVQNHKSAGLKTENEAAMEPIKVMMKNMGKDLSPGDLKQIEEALKQMPTLKTLD